MLSSLSAKEQFIENILFESAYTIAHQSGQQNIFRCSNVNNVLIVEKQQQKIVKNNLHQV